MASKYQAPRGTFDVLPGEAVARSTVEHIAEAIFDLAGYAKISTPAFEDTDLFVRGVGRSTDIVQKEMFTFEDKGGRSVTLRPEGTAPICRAYVEHGMHKLAQPVKLFYVGPFFRHERPQAGRFRQFHQIGAEVIGTDSPLADAEAIILLDDLLATLAVPGVELRLGSLGSLESRTAYLDRLKGYLRAEPGGAERGRPGAHRDEPAARLRRQGRGHAGCDGRRADDPRLPRRGGRGPFRAGQGPARRRRDRVPNRPDSGARPRLLHADHLLVRLRSARRPVGDRRRWALRRPGRAAGRAGRRRPSAGRPGSSESCSPWRGSTRGKPPQSDVFIVAEGEDDRRTAATLAAQLRRVGISAQVDLAGRGAKGQLKHAGRVGAQHVLRLTDGALALPGVPAEKAPRPDQLIEIIELLGRGIGADRDE